MNIKLVAAGKTFGTLVGMFVAGVVACFLIDVIVKHFGVDGLMVLIMIPILYFMTSILYQNFLRDMQDKQK
jgi:fructose-specific phosphotransferase system IIC component